jgi:hypothetical protein
VRSRAFSEVRDYYAFTSSFSMRFRISSRTLRKTASRSSSEPVACEKVTGLVALLLQTASAPFTTISQIRNTVITTARNNPPSSEDWDSRYGNGRVDAAGAVAAQFPHLIERVPE